MFFNGSDNEKRRTVYATNVDYVLRFYNSLKK